MSLVKRSKKLGLSEQPLCICFFNAKIVLHFFLCLREPINQSLSASCSRLGTIPRLSKDETNQPAPEYRVLGGRCNQQVVESTDWSTSPRAYYAWWSVQSPSVSNGQTGRLVHEHVMLSGRYSPRDVEWADRSTSPRACHARWSVQSPRSGMGRSIDQSSSMSCSVVGTVTEMSNGQIDRPVPEHVMLGGQYRHQVYHVCLTKSPTSLFEKIVSSY